MLKQLALALSLFSTPLLADDISVDTYRGTETVQANPAKIAVFDLAALDSLSALGIKPDGVVSPIFLDILKPAAEDAVVVGSLFEPDFEALFALEPDLIIAGGRTQEAVPELAKLAPTIDMTIWEDTIGQGLDRLMAYGAIFDKETKAAALRDNFLAKLETAKAAVANKGSALIVMTNGPKISAYGAKGRFGWLHTALDLPEAVEDVDATTHGEAISFEFIRDADPEILLVIDRLSAIGQDGASAQSTLDNVLVRETRAWKDGKVVFLSAAPIYVTGGGIQSMNLTLDEIMNGLGDS